MQYRFRWLPCAVIVLFILFSVQIPGIASASYIPPQGVLAPDEVDFGGATVTFLSEGHREGPFVTEGDVRYNRLEEAKELFNIGDINFIDGGTQLHENIMSRVMAGESTHDIYHVVGNRNQYWSLVSEGAFFPAETVLPDEYYEEYMLDLGREMLAVLDFRGVRYGFKTHWCHARNGSMYFTLYNRTLIDEAGLPDPYELYQNGDWTWENMADMAIDLTQDTTGDGDIDQYGMTWMGAHHLIYFALSNNASTFEFDEDGWAKFAFDQPEAIETIRQVHEWRTVEGIMGGGMDDFIAGNAAFLPVEWIWAHRFPKADMEDAWDVVPIPMGPSASQHVYPTNDARGTFMPVNAEDPEGLIALKHFLYRKEDIDPEITIPPNWVDRYVISRQHLEVIETGMLEWSGEIDMFTGTEFNSMLQGEIEAALAGEKSATAAMDEIKPAAQSWLDELFDQ